MARKFSPSDYQIITSVGLGLNDLWTVDVECVVELDEYGFVIGRHLLQQDKHGNDVLTELVGGIRASALEWAILAALNYEIETCPVLKARIAEKKADFLALREATAWDRRREEACK